MPRLTGNTIIRNPETGADEVLYRDQELPAWAEGLVGDHLLDGEVVTTAKQADVEPPVEADEPTSTSSDEEGEWVVTNGDQFLGLRSRWVSSVDKAQKHTTAEKAQARLEQILPEHPEAAIEKLRAEG